MSFVTYLSSGHQCPDNFPATEVEEYCPEDTPADEQQVRRRAVDCQCPPGEFHVLKEQEDKTFSTSMVWGKYLDFSDQ